MSNLTSIVMNTVQMSHEEWMEVGTLTGLSTAGGLDVWAFRLPLGTFYTFAAHDGDVAEWAYGTWHATAEDALAAAEAFEGAEMASEYLD